MTSSDASAPVAIFRADSSVVIGGGHVTRCLTLSASLASEGWRCIYAAVEESELVVPALGDVSLMPLSHEAANDAVALRRICPNGCDLLVVDHYQLSASYEQALRGWAKTILVIDDLANRMHECDFLLDAAPGRVVESYKPLVPERCGLLLGGAYALLRPEFSELRSRALARRDADMPVRRILISFGATDAGNATAMALRAVSLACDSIEVDVILGKEAPHIAAVRRQIETMENTVNLHVQTDRVADLMAAADLAIGAAGGTSLERCCLGLPSLILVTADNQNFIASEMQKSGVARVTTADTLAHDLEELIANGTARREMAKQAALLCDGLGARRVVSAVSPIYVPDGRAVTLRPATMADGELMLEWQSYPDVRRHSRNPQAPKRDEHFSWLRGKLADPATLLMVIEHGSEPAGILRLDPPHTRERREVSIYLDPSRQRAGIGKAALRQLRRLLPYDTFEAHVFQANQSSLRLFASAGYQQESDGCFIDQPRSGAVVGIFQ